MGKKKKWRWWFRVIHRDVGYFLFGMTIIYSLSGIALNHLNDWDPSYAKINNKVHLDMSSYDLNNKEDVLRIIDIFGEQKNYKKHIKKRNGAVKVFLKKGSFIIFPSGDILYEKWKRRPVFHAVNYLHYNPGKWWLWFSDFFAAGLIIIAITGIFIVKGKNSITGRGLVYTILGIIIPILFLLLYYR